VSAGTNVESCHLEVVTVPEHARRVANEFGCDLTDHKPQQLTSELLDSSDLVLVMSHEHIDIVARVTQNARSKTLLLGQWVGIGDIEDPLQGDVDKYRQCYSVLALAIESWRKKLT
jgi:protein-tyrosine phosphatase